MSKASTFNQRRFGEVLDPNSKSESSGSDRQRTELCQVRGKWVGSYRMSRGIEKLIRRTVAPNADVQCFATET